MLPIRRARAQAQHRRKILSSLSVALGILYLQLLQKQPTNLDDVNAPKYVNLHTNLNSNSKCNSNSNFGGCE